MSRSAAIGCDQSWSAVISSMGRELRPHGIEMTGLHVGYVDTDMAANIQSPKADPREVAELALDGVEAGLREVLAGEISRQVKAALAGDLAGLYPQLAA